MSYTQSARKILIFMALSIFIGIAFADYAMQDNTGFIPVYKSIRVNHPDLTQFPSREYSQVCVSTIGNGESYANGGISNAEWDCYPLEIEGYGP